MPRRVSPVALAAVLVAGAFPSGAAAERGRCAATGSRTVDENRQARVYSARPGGGDRRLFGCLRSTGRRLLLASAYDDEYVTSGDYRDVRLAGRFVAFVYEHTDISCKAACPPGYDATQSRVVVRDLRTRRRRAADAAVQAGTLWVSTAGVAAWLAPAADGSEVRVFDGAGSRALDHGAIDAASLVLSGLRLYWIGGGQPRTAALTPP